MIAAGYPAPMAQFIQSDPGLQSRFTRFLKFDDYAPDELLEIFEHFVTHDGYSLAATSRVALLEVLRQRYEARDERFGNARMVRNLFDEVISGQSLRLSLMNNKLTRGKNFVKSRSRTYLANPRLVLPEYASQGPLSIVNPSHERAFASNVV